MKRKKGAYPNHQIVSFKLFKKLMLVKVCRWVDYILFTCRSFCCCCCSVCILDLCQRFDVDHIKLNHSIGMKEQRHNRALFLSIQVFRVFQQKKRKTGSFFPPFSLGQHKFPNKICSFWLFHSRFSFPLRHGFTIRLIRVTRTTHVAMCRRINPCCWCFLSHFCSFEHADAIVNFGLDSNAIATLSLAQCGGCSLPLQNYCCCCWVFSAISPFLHTQNRIHKNPRKYWKKDNQILTIKIDCKQREN